MKTKITLGVLVLICFVSFSAKPQSKSSQWEYKTVAGKCSDEKRLNPSGAEGWELVGFSTYTMSYGPVEICIFKRAK